MTNADLLKPVYKCKACTVAGLLVCTCDYYAKWVPTPPCPAPRRIRSGGYRTGYRDGWKAGYAKGYHDRQQEERNVA